MTRRTAAGPRAGLRGRNEHILSPLARTHWRASLVPAAAGTPAPIAYVNAAAVKELVAGHRPRRGGSPEGDTSPFRAQWRGRVGWGPGPRCHAFPIGFRPGSVLSSGPSGCLVGPRCGCLVGGLELGQPFSRPPSSPPAVQCRAPVVGSVRGSGRRARGWPLPGCFPRSPSISARRRRRFP